MGVRDPGKYPEFLCGCKRPGVIELGKITYAHGWMRMSVEFRDEIPFKEGRM